MNYLKLKKMMLLFIGVMCCGCSFIPWDYTEHDGFPECYDKDQKIFCDWSNRDDSQNN